MKKFLLTSFCVALTGMAYAALPTPLALARSTVALNDVPTKSKAMMPIKKVTPTPQTQWGEWSEVGTSTITFPAEEFLYTGTAKSLPTYVRTDAADETHLQYRFDGALISNVEGVDPNPLYVDVYGNEATVYATPLPQSDLGIYAEQFPGPYSICDGAVLYDMESYRALNAYTATPMSMTLFLNIYDTSLGETEGLLSSGNVDIKLDVEAAFTIPSSLTIGGDMGMGLLKVEGNDRVWGINYALVKGDGNTLNLETFEMENVVDRILKKDDSLMIMTWMAGDIMACPMEGPGVYTLGAVAYDENDNVLSTATSDIYYMPAETWNWKSLGNAAVEEDFLREVFAMNLSNAGITPDGAARYEVEIEESTQTPGLYRLKNLYGPSHPYAGIFSYLNEFPVYTYLNCSNPQACYIYNMPTGFVVKDDQSGEIKLGCKPSVYLDEGFPLDFLQSEYAADFGTMSEGVITFTPQQVYLSVPVYKDYLGVDWFASEMLTQTNFTVTLPANSAVKGIATDAAQEYYDINGQRVSQPTGKGVYIIRTGTATRKVIL